MSAQHWFLSRAKLRRDGDVRAIARLLIPDDDDKRVAASHRLVWSLFADVPPEQWSIAQRDASASSKTLVLGDHRFLWHEEAPGSFLIFSPHKPASTASLFDIETRPFTQWPQAGERFAFFLRANPTISLPGQAKRADGKRAGGKPVDVIMHALHATPGRKVTREPLRAGEGRALLRETMLDYHENVAAGDPSGPAIDWLRRKAARNGFALEAVRINSYRRVALQRNENSRQQDLVFGQGDFEGTLSISDPLLFCAALRSGFGRSKAFGCGLMLLARQENER